MKMERIHNFRKTQILVLLSLLSISIYSTNAQEEIKASKWKFNISSDSIYSDKLETFRAFKIFRPIDFNASNKYPIIYVFDAEWMFQPVVLQSRLLSDFDVIPKCVVIGINHLNRNNDLGLDWKTGNLNQFSQAFKEFLIDELYPKIEKEHSGSGFSVLVGHSNGASFAHQVFTNTIDKFDAVISQSQNLFGNQLEELAEFISNNTDKNLYYYTSSGHRDATPRLESGKRLDSLFANSKKSNFQFKHRIYDADHNGLAVDGLSNGLAFVFKDYKHYNDWDEKLIDSLTQNSISAKEFLTSHAEKMKSIYGVDFKFNMDDLSLMQAMANTVEQIEEIQQFEIENFGKTENFYANYAQYYEYIESYEKALEFWETNLAQDYEHNANFFYYRRPIYLLYRRMKEPKRAIEFAENYLGTSNLLNLQLNYTIARISALEEINNEKGKKAILYCISNFEENPTFSLEDAEVLKRELEK